MRYFVVCSYDGTDFIGWQHQETGRSMQDEIEKVLSKILNEPIKIYASGRTDAKVHAFGQTFHFDVSKEIEDVGKTLYSFNRLLPPDITFNELSDVEDDFHARFDATSKAYLYVISTSGHDVFNRNYRYELNRYLNVDAMKEASEIFVGTHCFQNFTSKEKDEQNFVRTINRFQFGALNECILIKVWGNGFMRYMVRMIVGTLIEVGLGKLTVNDVKDLLEKNPRSVVSYKAPPQGLYLESVQYEEKLL